MATQIKPAKTDLHDQDFYAWSKGQADLLRAGRFSELDLAHLIEEIDDLGESLKRSVRSRIRTTMEHFLKLEHSPAQEPRGGWYDTILGQRSDLLDELTPSLRREVESALPALYERARQNAATSLRKHGEHAAADALPLHARPDRRRLAAVTGWRVLGGWGGCERRRDVATRIDKAPVRGFVCYANHPNFPLLQECHLMDSVSLAAMITIVR